MKRIPEPDLMVEPGSVAAYAAADFSEPHSRFVRALAEKLDDLPDAGKAADLGCGSCDVTVRFAAAYPGWSVDAVDGSIPMLAAASAAVARAGIAERVALHALALPAAAPDARGYDLLFANSLLHHLKNPATLWATVGAWAADGGRVFVMDLMRPATRDHARALVERHAGREREDLRSDFYRSLLSAYEPHEVRAQLDAAGLASIDLEVVSDRHWIAWGALPPRASA